MTVIKRIPDKIAASGEIKCLSAIINLIFCSEFTAQNMRSVSIPASIRDDIYGLIVRTWQKNERVRISRIYTEISSEEYANRMFFENGLPQSAEADAVASGWKVDASGFIALHQLASVSRDAKERILAGSAGLQVMAGLVAELDRPALRFDCTPIVAPAEAEKGKLS